MIILLFDFIIILVSLVLFLDFKRGFVWLMCARISMPSIIRFVVGPISISNVDFFSIVLMVALLLELLRRRRRMPREFILFFLLDFLVCFILILLSSRFVPIDFQLISYTKTKILQEGIFCIGGFYALSNIDIKKDLHILWIVAIVCGVYGIIAYLINLNPYITGMSILYNGEEDIIQNFLDETRAGLIGRAYGTTEHPLAWGQLWNLLIIFILSFRKEISKWLFYPIMIIGIVNIILCGSRSSLIAFFLSIFIYCFIWGAKRFLGYAVVIMASLVSLLFFIDNSKFTNSDTVKYFYATIMFWDDSYAREANIIGSSSNMRNNQLEESINISLDNPFGIGYDYQSYARKTEKRISNELLGLESIVFKKMVEQGILGLLFFYVCLWYLYLGTKKYGINRKNKIKLLAFTFGYLANITFTGMQGVNWSIFVVLMFCYYHIFKKEVYVDGKVKPVVRFVSNTTR